MANIHSTISFGLVSIPVIMNPVIKNNDTAFNQLHTKCHSRISYIKYCKHCKKPIKENEIIKGFEFEKGKYLTFKKDELNKLKPNNEKEIEIVSFVPAKSIDATYFEKSYILNTEKKSKAYALFCEALKKSNLVAVAKTIITTKFYYCILRFLDNQIILTTLYFEEERNIPKNNLDIKINDKELKLALKLIDELKGKFEPVKYKDEYQDNIRNAIENKLNGKEIKNQSKKNKQKINDLMEALEKSLNQK